jgi:hypothetical protein
VVANDAPRLRRARAPDGVSAVSVRSRPARPAASAARPSRTPRAVPALAAPAACALVLLGLARAPSFGLTQAWWTLAFNLALLVALFWLALAMGRALLLRVAPEALAWPGGAVLAIVVGCGLLSTGLFALGLQRLYYPPLLAALLLALAVALRGEALRGARDLWRTARARAVAPGRSAVENWLVVVCAALIAATFLVVALRTPLPLRDFDAVAYHQVGVRLYLQAHAMIPLAAFQNADGPIDTELLFLLGAAFGSDTFSQVLVWGQGLLTTALVVCLGARFWGRLAGWLGGLTYVSIAIVALFFAVPYNDGGLALGEMTCVVALVMLCARPSCGGALAGGLLLGFTLGQKMSALPFTASLAAAALVLCLRRPFWPAARAVALAGVVGLLVALPWYVRNQLWFANPFVPLSLGSVQAVNLDPTIKAAPLPAAPAASLPLLGLLTGAASLFWYSVSPLTVLAPLAALVRPRRVGLALAAAAVVGYLYWLRYTPWNLPPRYLLCWIAPLAVCVGAVLAWPGWRTRRPLLHVPLAAPVVWLALFNLLLQAYYLGNREGAAVPYLLGRISRAQYLAGVLPPYRAMLLLNRLDRRDPVALLGDARVYYLQVPSFPDWGNQLLPAFKREGSPEDAARALWAEGARYVLAADSLVPPRGHADPWAARLRDRALSPLGGAGGYTIYRLRHL